MLNNKYVSMLFFVGVLGLVPVSSQAALSNTCFYAKPVGYAVETLMCSFLWSASDDIYYNTGVINFTWSLAGGGTNAGPWVFDAAGDIDNRKVVFGDYSTSGAGFYTLSSSATLYKIIIEHNDFYLDYHPSTFKSHSKSIWLPGL
jgi:hypothetical protein